MAGDGDHYDHRLTLLEGQSAHTNNDLDTIVGQMQKLTDGFHAHDKTLERIEAQLVTGLKDIADIKRALETKFALQSDFLVIRNQFWLGISVVILSIVGAGVTWLVKGGLASAVK